MIRIAHIINPVNVDADSDLAVAQPITFETMRRARRYADGDVGVELYSAQYPEDRSMVPDEFLATSNLDRSVLDIATFRRPRKLPLLADILERLYQATEADYLVYTNVDIGVLPHFYSSIKHLLEQGNDAFVINRRNIPRVYDDVRQIPLMYSTVGRPHRGWDCFVFPREVLPHFDLGDVCIGVPRVGLALLANMVVHSEHFREFKNLHLTFHRGDDRAWSARSGADYAEYNTRQVVGILTRLEQMHGRFERGTPPGRFLSRKRFFGPLYETYVRIANARASRSSF